MGQYFKFKCGSCSYTATVSGGLDGGMIANTQTFICLRCKVIQDLTIELIDWESRAVEQAPPPVCTKCHQNDLLKVWDSIKKPCPKCRNRMETNPDITILWD